VPEIWDLMKYEVDHREGRGVHIVPIGCLKD